MLDQLRKDIAEVIVRRGVITRHRTEVVFTMSQKPAATVRWKVGKYDTKRTQWADTPSPTTTTTTWFSKRDSGFENARELYDHVELILAEVLA